MDKKKLLLETSPGDTGNSGDHRETATLVRSLPPSNLTRRQARLLLHGHNLRGVLLPCAYEWTVVPGPDTLQ
jgi:hypothetical protein